MAAAWHRAMGQDGSQFGRVHAEKSWREDYEIAAGAIMATIDPADWLRVADAVCEWVWLAPEGPVRGGRVHPNKATPAMLAKHISSDIDAAGTWYAQREAAQ